LNELRQKVFYSGKEQGARMAPEEISIKFAQAMIVGEIKNSADFSTEFSYFIAGEGFEPPTNGL
jgi:hypothetical protein